MKQIIEDEKLSSFFSPPGPGDLVTGRVVNKGRSTLFVDLAPYGIGIITGREFLTAKSILKNTKVGDEVSAKVVDIDNEDGYIELSMSKARNEMVWERLKRMKQNNESLTVVIEKANKGGLIADVEGIPSFIPVSQLKPEHYPKVEDGDQAKILQKLQRFIGQELKVSILTLDREQKTIILSEKEADWEKAKELLRGYKVGDVVQGEITSVVDFGAFIKFPPFEPKDSTEKIEGLIHISELDWQLIENPTQVVKPGDKVKAKIIDISNGRVSLSLKALKKDPWEGIDQKYKKGDTIKGKVTKFNPFGAFIEIAPKIQGLIHVSEFQNETEMKKMLEVGKKYEFQISFIEPEEHRMILKLAEQTK
jgi:small subunit ribosomal protein S1